MKNAEGEDRITQRILIDGIGKLLRPLTVLFSKIYEEKEFQNNGRWRRSPRYTKKGAKMKSQITDQWQIFAQLRKSMRN